LRIEVDYGILNNSFEGGEDRKMNWVIGIFLGFFIFFVIEFYISNNMLQISKYPIKNKKIGKKFQKNMIELIFMV
jgi:Sec-independent protein secretion pathway component TatC